MKPLDYYHRLIAGCQGGLWATLQRGGLRLLSWPYGWATHLRNTLYSRGWKHTYKARVAVVSVGNLTLGGTGKTPCVEYVARSYREQERLVAILSRGYGAGEGQNDEALVLHANLPDVPHLQGVDRVALASVAVEELESEVLVLDDGFQHRRLARDLDVVLIDATAPWGHGYLCPRGLLRESPRGLARAGAVVLTRCDQVDPAEVARIRERVARLAPDAPVAETTHRPVEWVNSAGATLPLEALQDKPWVAFCGVGNPEAFRRTLQDLGGLVTAFRTFPDHHRYSRADVEELRGWVRRQATEGVVVTTQKDLVKLPLTQLGERDLWALRIRLHFLAGQERFDRKLKDALG
ncbi:MAG: tetraacyldisaccharide 4'-kinase [Gemmataceae bacterium]|nr:tetraacyldisaccharide 4'-kinase [Gemmataceae bacterium]